MYVKVCIHRHVSFSYLMYVVVDLCCFAGCICLLTRVRKCLQRKCTLKTCLYKPIDVYVYTYVDMYNYLHISECTDRYIDPACGVYVYGAWFTTGVAKYMCGSVSSGKRTGVFAVMGSILAADSLRPNVAKLEGPQREARICTTQVGSQNWRGIKQPKRAHACVRRVCSISPDTVDSNRREHWQPSASSSAEGLKIQLLGGWMVVATG